MVNLWGPGAFGAARPSAVRPPFAPDNAPGDSDDWYKDCTSPLARDGTEFKSGWLNGVLANLRAVIRKSGVSATNLDDNLLIRAIRSQGVNFIPAIGGTANALTAALDLDVPVYTPGLVFTFVTGVNANTGPVVVDFGAGVVDLVNHDGSALVEGEIPAGSFLTARYDGERFRLTHPAPRAVAPFFRMYTPADNIPHNVPTVVTGYAGQETNGLRDSVLSLAAGTITIGPKDAGVWVFTANGKIELGAETQISDLRKNSLPIASGSVEITGLGNLFWNHPSSTVITRCVAGDVIAFAYTHKSSSGIVQRMAQVPYVQFSGARIR